MKNLILSFMSIYCIIGTLTALTHATHSDRLIDGREDTFFFLALFFFLCLGLFASILIKNLNTKKA